MTTSTSGITLQTRRRWLAESVEVVSSMRFAISLLAMIAIASIIGTVMKQNEPMPNYVNQFGPFWFDIFNKLGLYNVYSAPWFLAFMTVLVISTSLCIWRNAPKMLKDMRSWRENVREQSLRNFHHKAEWVSASAPQQLAQEVSAVLVQHGYKTQAFAREGATLIAAKQGAANKWGYIFAHCAIVIICLGGVLDSNLPVSIQTWLLHKTPFTGNGVIAEIPAQHRLGAGNPSFRGNAMIPEGATANTAILQQPDGVLIQELPFSIQLKKFVIEHYSTGMPKLFASDVTVTDPETGKTLDATIKVNEPLIYKGIAIYQSSFDDGGSRLTLTGWPMRGAVRETFAIKGEVGSSTPLTNGKGSDYTIEWSGFRPFNVENMAQNGQDVRAVKQPTGLADSLDKQLGSAAKKSDNKDLRNVGPSVQYKLRDTTGQAREFHNYMVPVQLDGAEFFLSGVRDNPGDQFRYLRIPADDNGTMEDWMRLRAALHDPAMRGEAARRYAQRSSAANPADTDKMRAQLELSARRGLDIFAGEGTGKESGFAAIARFLERVPAAEQEKTADIFMKILNGSLWELWQVARAHDALPAVAADEKHGRFLQLATNALSDAGFYGAPVLLQLKAFDEVKASVLQMTRSPGKKIVYLGCLLLIAGVFAMLYIRERRLWVWIRPEGKGAQALMAMSTQRKTLDFEKEYAELSQKLAQAGAAPQA